MEAVVKNDIQIFKLKLKLLRLKLFATWMDIAKLQCISGQAYNSRKTLPPIIPSPKEMVSSKLHDSFRVGFVTFQVTQSRKYRRRAVERRKTVSLC